MGAKAGFVAKTAPVRSRAVVSRKKSIGRGPTERQWQATVIAAARLHGWLCFWTPNSRHSPAGEPDLRLLRVTHHPDRHVGRYVLLELKTSRGKLSPAQQDVANKLWCCEGVEFHVVRPGDWDQLLEILR